VPRILANDKKMTFEEYLEFEERAESKHEFVDGFVFAMAGTSNNHNLLTTNLVAQLRPMARNLSCRVYANDMKLQVSEGDFYYPDVFVVCDPDNLTSNIKSNACFIIEILSNSTAEVDRGEKWQNYRKLSSLQTYILISQQRKFIEVYGHMTDGSWRYEVLEDEGKLELLCINASLTLDEIYEDVDFSKVQESA
jgi:Uma2 family endonuclease